MLLKTDVACACMMSPYNSVDLIPANSEHATVSSKEIGIILRDSSLPLFERYRAMFSLRNRGGDECAIGLGEALVKDQSSATFRHGVASGAIEGRKYMDTKMISWREGKLCHRCKRS